jgi:flagellar hook-associated protein 3 FlgL
MRVTQSMLSNNMLRNLNNSYGKMSKLQDQLNSGKVITRPSDDPVVAVKGMGYRVELDKNEQYQRNMGTANTWLDTSDSALDQVGSVLNRVKELVVQAASDTNTSDDRSKIAIEITEIKNHLRDLGNTKAGENYIFSGAHVDKPLFDENGINSDPTATQDGFERPIEIHVFDSISLPVNTNVYQLFSDVDSFMTELETLLNDPESTGKDISATLGVSIENETMTVPGLDAVTNKVLETRASIGARQNRVELMSNRLEIQEINVTKQMSENEDADYAKTITEMSAAESVHQAALSVGAKIIQQTLVDFMR